MFERFTDMSRRVIMRAQEEAKSLGHSFVGSEHLLLAIAQSPGLASSVLAEAGAGADRVRAEVTSRALHLDDDAALAAIGIDLGAIRASTTSVFGEDAWRGEPTWTELAKQVMQDAYEEADALGATYNGVVFVGTEHLLLGVVRHEEGVAGQVLSALRVDVIALRKAVADRVNDVLELRSVADGEPIEQRNKAVMQRVGKLGPEDRSRIDEPIRELDRIRLDAWGEVVAGAGRAPKAELVDAYIAKLRPAVEATERALQHAGF